MKVRLKVIVGECKSISEGIGEGECEMDVKVLLRMLVKVNVRGSRLW